MEKVVMLVDFGGSREALRVFEQYILAFHATWAKKEGVLEPILTASVEDGDSVQVCSSTPELQITITQFFDHEKTLSE